MSTFQLKFNHVNPFSCSWDISRQSFYSYWRPDIGPLVVEIQAEWSWWQKDLENVKEVVAELKRRMNVEDKKQKRIEVEEERNF